MRLLSSTTLAFFARCFAETPRARRTAVLMTLAGVAAGVTNTLLLALVNRALAAWGRPQAATVVAYAALCLLLPLSRNLAQTLPMRLSAQVTYELRMNLCASILRAPLRSLERLGAARLLAALTDDVPSVAALLVSVPTFTMHLTLVLACLVYLALLSLRVLVVVLACLVAGVAIYQVAMSRAMRHLRRTRDLWDALLGHFRALADGIKELKLHQGRRAAFTAELLEPTAAELRQVSLQGQLGYTTARSWSQGLFFILVGLMLFVLPAATALPRSTASAYVLTILYMIGSIEAFLGVLPTIGRVDVAVKKIAALSLSVNRPAAAAEAPPQAAAAARFESLELRGLTHSYLREERGDEFVLGPVDLTLHPGEIVLLQGGNGSGKTTLAKLITGLYQPQSGEIRCNGRLLAADDREAYLQLFSAVFADSYVFESLLGLGAGRLDAEAMAYLERLQLAHKVSVAGQRFSTTDLSHGQRKRLALLTAWLEDRAIYVFDEWAATQEPAFREVFYLQLLPELKARGKLVLVISHDDRYFGVADRIVKLEYGRISRIEEPWRDRQAARRNLVAIEA
jgi:putative ATP-binding cassette transporter